MWEQELSVGDTLVKKELEQTLEALGLLEEICIILEAQDIVDSTSKMILCHTYPHIFRARLRKDFFSAKNPQGRRSKISTFRTGSI